jgi:superfamily II DNA or RNA helicase
VRARIARIILGSEKTCARLGAITLKPHQQSAVTRAEAAIDEFGGVLLCDDVGLGKTFVATAIARRFSRSVVVAPAALASMWRDALDTTETNADFLTFERLSRATSGPATPIPHDLVIVDEAHHARNPATRRYQSLAELAREARVVLLTATPIHNDPSEMTALLSLFLGSRAQNLTMGELARCVVRREHHELAQEIAIPEIVRAPDREIPDNPAIVQELMSLPPPLPVRDGGVGGTLIGRGLVHQWASSEAALREAIRRRIARAAALAASLESGSYPTAQELKTWIYGEGALQLGFPELLSSQVDDAPSLLDSVRSHADALQDFLARHRDEGTLDVERADILGRIRAAHPKGRIVAFAQYAETVSMLYRQLAPAGGVAMLDARGGLVAGGKLTRDETLARFAPRALHANPPPPAERIDVLLTTDLLSEGVNLQDADVVVHLDLPWTAARLEQRVGRVARLGSLRSRVHVCLLRPPASAAAVLRSELILQGKWSKAKRAIGSSSNAPFTDGVDTRAPSARLESAPAKAQRLHAILERWRRPQPNSDGLDADAHAATVHGPADGFIAAISVDGRPLLLATTSGCVSANLEAQIEACLLCESDDLRTNPDDYREAVERIHSWFEQDLGSSSAGVASSHSRVRRHFLQRIESAIQNAPPHLRTARSHVAARARSIATGQHGAALEAELELLARSKLRDHELLMGVVGLESGRQSGQRTANPAPTLAIHAVLLLRPRSRRSRPLRALESP